MERMASTELESEHSRRFRTSLEGPSARVSQLSNSSPVDFEQPPNSFKKQKPGQHDITIGKPDKSTVDLLEEVPLENQLYLEYQNVRAWVPAMAPGGGGILPGIPKFTLPSFKSSRTKQTEAPEEKDKMRQVGVLLLSLRLPSNHLSSCQQIQLATTCQFSVQLEEGPFLSYDICAQFADPIQHYRLLSAQRSVGPDGTLW